MKSDTGLFLIMLFTIICPQHWATDDWPKKEENECFHQCLEIIKNLSSRYILSIQMYLITFSVRSEGETQ